MARSTWKWRREGPPADHPSAAAHPGTDPDQVRSADRLGADVIDLTAEGGAERYSAWADRLRDKRDRNQAEILGTPRAPVTDNWSAASVLGTGREDRPLDEQPTPHSYESARALEVLGLGAGAATSEVACAFRTLAKVHHPDRWAEADAAVQRDHAEAMLKINAAYRALRGPAPVT